MLSEFDFDAEIGASPQRSSYQVKIASRQNDQPNSRAVQLAPVAELRTDDDEVHFRALGLPGNDASGHTYDVERLRFWFGSRTGIGEARWYAVTTSVPISEGGTAQLNLPIIGIRWHDERRELWLLVGPREVWPDSWWGT